MNDLLRTLIKHLVGKWIEITSIPGSIRDVAETIVAKPRMSLQQLNSYVSRLGWGDSAVDEYTLCLILATLDPDLATPNYTVIAATGSQKDKG